MEEQKLKKNSSITIIVVALIIFIAAYFIDSIIFNSDSIVDSTNITLVQTSCTEKLFNVSYAHNHSQCLTLSCENFNASWGGSFNPQRNTVRCRINNSSIEVQINSSKTNICEMLEKDIRNYINCSLQ